MSNNCFHCHLPISPSDHFIVRISSVDQSMCCAGCQAVAQAIVDSGMESYYQHRTESAPTGKELVPEFLQQIKAYDIPDVQERFITHQDDDMSEVSLVLEGITCAACVWLNEKYLSSLEGVTNVQINYTNHRARIRWDNKLIQLSEIIGAVSRIGYLAHPYDPARQQAVIENERKNLLRRIGVAGLFGMQVMTMSVALYTGDWWGIDPDFKVFFEWASLIFTVPVLIYSANPFYKNAFNDLKRRTVGMDVPVTLGMSVAFIASVWSTITQQSDVYFDSVVMFTFFLLVARYFELIARRHASDVTDAMAQLIPAVATKIIEHEEIITPVAELKANDVVLVKPGETIPADGEIIEGISRIDESLLTGESLTIQRTIDADVFGGSINMVSPIKVRVKKVGQGTLLSNILDLLDQAMAEKPSISKFADKVALYFVSAILTLATMVAVFWWSQGDANWIAITVSVLVVTCPCALSLATPVALSAGSGRLTQMGLLTVKGHSIETLSKVNHFVFDKTGTLTEGKMHLVSCDAYAAYDAQECIKVAAMLESGSEHPIAQAIRNEIENVDDSIVLNIENHPGQGISGTINKEKWLLGNADFIQSKTSIVLTDLEESSETTAATVIWLVKENELCARMLIGDQLRVGAKVLIHSIQENKHQVSILSGDNQAAVSNLANSLNISHWFAQMKPENKLELITQFQKEGDIVAMIGDGVNDAPVLAQAQLSIAMGSGTQLASVSSDMILLSDRLEHLVDAISVSKKTMRIIKQNIGWALLYNICAIPAAAMGFIPPWLAAIGMSLSSLIVVGNSLRLLK